MIEREHKFESADGLPIFWREWLPGAGEPRGIVYILHGLSEHSGRYRHVAEALTVSGYVCIGIDQRGHGKSGGTRGYLPAPQLAVEDLCQLHSIVRLTRPDGPAFAFCHSMGSLIGLGFVLRYPGQLQGLVTCGAPLHGEFARPAWLIALCLRAAPYLPKLRLSPPGAPSVLTADRDMLREWKADPLVDRGMWRVGTTAALIHLCRDICRDAAAIDVPLLILHGTADRLVPATGSEFLAAAVRSDDVTLKLYRGLRHELVNEVERDEIIGDIHDWLAQRL